MTRLTTLCATVLAATLWGPAQAQTQAQDRLQGLVDQAVQEHVLPQYAALSASSAALEQAAQAECSAQDARLQERFFDAFDAWVRVSHLRFGPSERDNRAFALAFWPDTRSKTPKALSGLIAAQDPVAYDAAAMAEVSIAAQGFYALEFLLFDPVISQAGSDTYRCALVQSLSAGIAHRAAAIEVDWRDDYAAVLTNPATEGAYRNNEEAAQELFKAVLTGLQFTAQTRLGRPLGSFERPRPKRAEAWRSGRSLRHVELSLGATRELALILAGTDSDLAQRLDQSFADTLRVAASLDDPVFAGVSEPAGRLRVEVLQQYIDNLRDVIAAELGLALGVSAGFNALDGD